MAGTRTRHDRRAYAAVMAVVVALWLACWPFADVGVNDDFGYAFVVKRLLETGHLTYDGWCNAMLGAQALWGGAFAAAFGFSHDVLRLSTLPLACACAAMTYGLHRRFGIAPRWSAFAALLLVASPIFTPWSASFMTDVPGLTLTLALLHASLSLARAATPAALARCVALVVALGLIGGTIRQTNFAFAAVALALEGVRRWRSPGSLVVLVAAVAVECWVAVATSLWQARQPYATPEGFPANGTVAHAAVAMSGLTLTFVSMAFPLGLAALRLGRIAPRGVLVGLAVTSLATCGGIVWLMPQAFVANYALGLWSGSTLTPTGMLFDATDAPGVRPTVIGVPARVAIAGAVYWMLALATLAAVRHRRSIRNRLRRFNATPEPFAVASFGVQALVYVVFLLPRASAMLVFDRYLLALLPIVSIALLRACRRRLARVTPGSAAWTMLTLYALLGAAIARDHFAELRLRDRIAADLMGTGVPRTAIADGLTFDAWTQLERRGYINDPRIVRPPGAFVPDPNARARSQIFWYLPLTPAVEPRWVVVSATSVPATLGDRRAYRYRAVLPPQDRVLLAWPLRSAVTTRPAGAAVDDATPSSR